MCNPYMYVHNHIILIFRKLIKSCLCVGTAKNHYNSWSPEILTGICTKNGLLVGIKTTLGFSVVVRTTQPQLF